MQPSSSFEIDSHVKGYHAYLDDWKPCRGEVLQAIPEPNNAVDKYAVCVLKDGEVVGHLKRGKLGRLLPWTNTLKQSSIFLKQTSIVPVV